LERTGRLEATVIAARSERQRKMSKARGARFTSNHRVSSPRAVRPKPFAHLQRYLQKQIVWRATSSLKSFPKNPRRHPEAQIAALMKSISRFWTIPILIDETATILAGHLRLEGAKRLGMTEVTYASPVHSGTCWS
jgi:hypothetical protein